MTGPLSALAMLFSALARSERVLLEVERALAAVCVSLVESLLCVRSAFFAAPVRCNGEDDLPSIAACYTRDI